MLRLVRAALAIVLLLAAAPACHFYNYKVDAKQARAKGLSEYPSVAIDIAVSPPVAIDAADLGSFTAELEQHVRATKVIPEVRRAPEPADLALRANIVRLEHKESWSIQHGSSEWYETTVDVELYDLRQARSLDRFSVSAGPGQFISLPGAPQTIVMRAMSNAARGIAGQLKKRR